MIEDATVTRTAAWSRFLDTGSEDAFAEVVARHINLVYSVAIRRSGGDEALAQDVVQTVFTDLVRKAAALPRNVTLAGWLYRHATFVAANLVRGEARRRQRELAAMKLRDPSGELDWSKLAKVLDDALTDLPERDRDAIVLRFLDQQPFAEVGRSLGVSADAARMRVERALERLRDLLARRGVNSTAAALGMVIGQQGVVAAPPALAATIATASTLAAVTAAPTPFLAVMMMMSTKVSLGVAAVAVAVATTVACLEHRTSQSLRAEIAELRAASTLRETPPDGSSPPSSAELDSLREDRVRLMALRDELGRLKEAARRMSDLEKENRSLREALASGQKSATEDNERDYEAEMQQGLALARMTFAKAWMLAFVLFAQQNGDQLPGSFEEAAKFYPTDGAAAASVLDPNRFEIVYHGLLKDIPNPAATIVIREREPFLAKRSDGAQHTVKTYGFADGHSELHSEPDGRFEDWERARMLPAAAPTQ